MSGPDAVGDARADPPDGSRSLRSLLFAPANHARRVQRIDDFEADAVVLDLEDAVPVEEKVATRALVGPALAHYRHGLRCVRVNALNTGLAYGDLDAAVVPALQAVVLPKTESPEHLQLIDTELTRLERLRGITPGSILLLPLLETALAIMRAHEIALSAPERTPRLIFGSGDFSVDIDVSRTTGGEELLYARSAIVVASRAARLAAPLDGPFTEIHDLEGLRADTVRSRSLGFAGRVVVYPGQVQTVNGVYSEVPQEEITLYRNIVRAFEQAESGGSASIQVDGTFVDYPVYRRALDVLAEHDNAAGA